MADDVHCSDIIGLRPPLDGNGEVCHRQASALIDMGSETVTRKTYTHLNIYTAPSTCFRLPTRPSTHVFHSDAAYNTLMVNKTGYLLAILHD